MKLLLEVCFLLFVLLVSGWGQASDEETFLAAREAYRKGDKARLEAYTNQLKSHVLEPYVSYWFLATELENSSPDRVYAYLARYDGTLLADRLRRDWLKVAGKQQNWARFSGDYPGIANPDTELSCYGMQWKLSEGEAGIWPDVRRLWFSGAAQPDSCTPLFNTMVEQNLLSPEEIWARIRLALEAGNVSVARQSVAYLPETERWQDKDLTMAADNPQRFLDRNNVSPNNRSGRELTLFAIYRLARFQIRQALPVWEKRQYRFNDSDQRYLWGQLGYRAALLQDPMALTWYGYAGTAPLDDNQLAWKARIALRLRDWPQVLSAIGAMTHSTQQRPAWQYWGARARKALGMPALANPILASLSTQSNYYGQLASDELGTIMARPAQVFVPDENDVSALVRLPGIQRALVLYRLDLRIEADREWEWATRGFNDIQLLTAAELARRNGWLDRAINTADKTVQLRDYDLCYPTPHRELMQSFAGQWQLDEAWVYGLIRQESRFVQDARSSAGAAGLMQLMPKTARWVARRLGLKNYKRSLIDELETNIQLGTYYLRYVYDKLGHPVLATAAYNAGPVRARQWQDPQPMEGAVYTESIPLNETRDYVQKVMNNVVHYAAQFRQKPVPLKNRMGTIDGKPDDADEEERG